MLTPAFELSQDDTFITACIKVPYAKASESDIYFNDYEFKFYCKPYFLRLNLPGKVLYCEDPVVTYNIDAGIFTVKMIKATIGEHFEGLDFLTKLLASRCHVGSIVPKIEVLGSVVSENIDIDWEIEQPICDQLSDDSLIFATPKTGFSNMYSCEIFKMKEETAELFDIVNPDQKTKVMRSKERLDAETEHFSEDHYLADTYQNDEVAHLLNYHSEWDYLHHITERRQENVTFTPEEKSCLRKFPNKEYLLEKGEVKSLLLGLVDILFAFSYNKRTTEGENTVESGWTVNKLSSTLCWLETFSSAKSVVQSCVRRSLCYPLFRHWELSMKVLDDTIKILSLGRKCVVKCLLEIHSLFNQSEPQHILNDLYITDYCIWAQGKSCCTKNLQQLAKALKNVTLTKADINLDLEELEAGAAIAMAEQSNNSEDISLSSTLEGQYGQVSDVKLCSSMEMLQVKNNSKENTK